MSLPSPGVTQNYHDNSNAKKKKKNRIETEPDPIRHHPVSFKERYKDDDYRMANIFTSRCSSKIVPEIRILNSLSFETA